MDQKSSKSWRHHREITAIHVFWLLHHSCGIRYLSEYGKENKSTFFKKKNFFTLGLLPFKPRGSTERHMMNPFFLTMTCHRTQILAKSALEPLSLNVLQTLALKKSLYRISYHTYCGFRIIRNEWCTSMTIPKDVKMESLITMLIKVAVYLDKHDFQL